MSGICMCGAEDCPQCHPEHFGDFPCSNCGEQISIDEDAPEGLCQACYEDGWRICEECGLLYQETEETPECPECAKKGN